MYVKMTSLKRQIKDLSELSGMDENTQKLGRLYNLLMDGNYITHEILEVPKEDWVWLAHILEEYWDTSSDSIWEQVERSSRHQNRLHNLERLMLSLPSGEVSQYV